MNLSILRDPSTPLPPWPASVYRASADRAAAFAAECSRDGAYTLERCYRRFADERRALAGIASGLERRETPPDLAAGRALVLAGRAAHVAENRLSWDASDSQIRTWAKRCAGEAGALIDAEPDELSAIAAALNHCRRYGVEPPVAPDAMDLPALRRLCSARWWRRRGRVLVTRRVDHARRLAGEVRSRADLYAADATVERWRESRTRNGELLEAIEAVNEIGDSFTLAELAERTTSNPELRRGELMTQVRGLEELSEVYGHRGLFITPTAPSEHHAVIESTNRPNPYYDGSTPTQVQGWLARRWALVRALLWKRRRLKLYGLRTVEPHHDGTPHWHLLVFAPSRELQHVRRAFLDVFLNPAELPADPKRAADRKRCGVKFETMRPEKGSAVAYAAKYIAKGIDGHQLEFTMTRGADGSLHYSSSNPATAAERIRAWASAWGIRQFQMLGTPAKALWRELRRLREPTESQIIEAARKAADEGDYAAHVAALGGVLKTRKQCPLAPHKEPQLTDDGERLGIYGEPLPDRVTGVEVNRWFLFPDLAFPSLRGFVAERAASLRAEGRSWSAARREARRERAAEKARRAMLQGERERERAAFLPAVAITRTHCWEIRAGGADEAPWTRVNNCNRRAEAKERAAWEVPPNPPRLGHPPPLGGPST